jgi:uncharacterized protein (DUF2147 family)
MTIATLLSTVGYIGNGVATVYAYPFKILDQSYLEVTVNGVTQALTTNYTVSGAGGASGGNVTFLTPPANLATVNIIRKTPPTQLLDLIDNDAFPAEALEQALDKLTCYVQEAGAAPTDVSTAVAAAAAAASSAAAAAASASSADADAATAAAAAAAYTGIPQVQQNGNYTPVLSDAGKHVYSKNTGAQSITLPLNASVAYPIGTSLTIVNNGTTNISFTTTGLVVYKAGANLAWATGGTLLPRGLCSWLKVEANTWFVSGSGLSA